MNRKRGKKEGMLHPIPKDDLPLMTFNMDHIGPLTSTSKGYKYLLVIVDGRNASGNDVKIRNNCFKVWISSSNNYR